MIVGSGCMLVEIVVCHFFVAFKLSLTAHDKHGEEAVGSFCEQLFSDDALNLLVNRYDPIPSRVGFLSLDDK